MQQCCSAASQQETANDLAGTGIRCWSRRALAGRVKKVRLPSLTSAREAVRDSAESVRSLKTPIHVGRAFGHQADDVFHRPFRRI